MACHVGRSPPALGSAIVQRMVLEGMQDALVLLATFNDP
jgi:hypothetical protein